MKINEITFVKCFRSTLADGRNHLQCLICRISTWEGITRFKKDLSEVHVELLKSVSLFQSIIALNYLRSNLQQGIACFVLLSQVIHQKTAMQKDESKKDWNVLEETYNMKEIMIIKRKHYLPK